MWVNLFVALILEVSGAVISQHLKKYLKRPLLLFVAKQNDLELQQVSLGCLWVFFLNRTLSISGTAATAAL